MNIAVEDRAIRCNRNRSGKRTLRQIKTAMHAAMMGVDGEHFMMTFKSGDRFIIPCKANDPNFKGDRNHHHDVLMTQWTNSMN